MSSSLSPDPGVLLHVTVVASDLAAALPFYDAVLGALNLERHSDFPDEEEEDADVDAVAYGRPGADPVLWVVAGTTPTTGAHLAFTASGPDAVEAFWRRAVEHGGGQRQAPRRWEIYRQGYFGAIVADPDGNLIEAVAHE
jgi:catechol 2,3-dioxygenase-like lactoylglutathione lyase family enzyme